MKITRLSCGTFCLVMALFLCGISVPKAFAAGNDQQRETAFAKQFSAFYPYTERRGMEPMNFFDGTGKTITLNDYKGQVVLLHFWATWCAPCSKELPTLQALQTQRAGEGFAIVPVALDFNKTQPQITQFMKKHGAEGLPALMVPENDKAWDTLATFPLPTSFLIGPNGQVLYKMIGDADWVSPESLALIDYLLTNQQK
jgi:thiol-disulfide isomerase/thioredoxin